MTLEDFANLMHDHSGMSISYMEEQIEAIKNEERSENKVHYETVEDFEKGIKMLKNLFGFEPKKFEPKNTGERRFGTNRPVPKKPFVRNNKKK